VRLRPLRSCAPCALAAALIALPLPTRVAAEAARRPDVLLVTIDTLRADALGWSGSSSPTPTLDALAERSFRSAAAVTPVPLTLPAHVSLMTGLVPRRHGVRINGHVLTPAPATLAERLARAGYRTGAVVSGFPLQRVFGLARGFDVYRDDLPVGPDGVWLERPAAETTRAALDFLRAEGSAPDRPWFLWVHYYDPHDPYTPPPGMLRPGPHGDYLGEVAAVDAALAPLLAELASRSPEALVVVTSDHGESLGEHQEATHGFFLYDATVRVPLMASWPGQIEPRRFDAPARLVDLLPTVLDLVGLESEPGVDGRSLRPLLTGSTAAWPPAELESWEPWLGYGWAPLRGLRDGRWKLIAAPEPELYDLRSDPRETVNRVDGERREARRLASELEALEAAAPSAREVAAPADVEALAGLAALGYLSATGSVNGPPASGLADPKHRIALKAQLDDAEAARRGGRPRQALAGFERALGEEPGNRLALLRVGQLRIAAGRPAAALEPLERLLGLDPAHAEARWARAEALTATRRFAEAAQEWRALLRLQPGRAVAWSNLAVTLIADGSVDEACAAAERAVELAPGDPEVAANAGAARFEQARRRLARGDRAGAHAALTRALVLDDSLRTVVAGDPALAALLTATPP